MPQNRVQLDQAELADRISLGISAEGKNEVQPGLFFHRTSQTGDVVYAVSEPSLCIISQGSKEVFLGDTCFRYDPANYLISTMRLPVSGQVVEASKELPYLSLRLVLDPLIVTSVLSEAGYAITQAEPNPTGIDVSELNEPLLNAVLRLVRTIDNPLEYQVLAPLVMREIVFRLLMGDQGHRLRHLAKLGGQSHRMVRAIQSIRENFDKPLHIEEMANELNMSVSSFHAHFKSATAMSPLQFQKQLRLQEARRLMLDENCDASEAGFRVGYEDAAQFNREYKRQFGNPPKRDIGRIRNSSISNGFAALLS